MSLRAVSVSRCPDPCASRLADHFGLLGPTVCDGHTVAYVSLAPEQWNSHFTHRHEAYLRDGAHVPALWARANGAETLLVAAYFLRPRDAVLVCTDSPLATPADLEGKRVGIYADSPPVPFLRIASHRLLEDALAAGQVASETVTIVDVVNAPPLSSSAEEVARWTGERGGAAIVEALTSGVIDAACATSLRASSALIDRRLRCLWISPTPHSGVEPVVITASRALADDCPHAIVDYLAALILAGRRAETDQAAALRYLADGAAVPVEVLVASYAPGLCGRIVPDAPDGALPALEQQKSFLVRHGYLRGDFSLHGWSDGAFIDAARARLDMSPPPRGPPEDTPA